LCEGHGNKTKAGISQKDFWYLLTNSTSNWKRLDDKGDNKTR